MIHSIEPLGDSAAIVVWRQVSDDEAARSVQSLAAALNRQWHPAYEAMTQAFASLTLHYSPLSLQWHEVQTRIEAALRCGLKVDEHVSPVVEIPVCYDPKFGLDLPDLSQIHQLPSDEIIRLHTAAEYKVRMIGFSPGFPYLSGLPDVLATARRSSPRLKVHGGSVAIGGRQCGIYPIETPGGWHILGRTPVSLFRPERDSPCLLTAGDRVRFFPITAQEFAAWGTGP